MDGMRLLITALLTPNAISGSTASAKKTTQITRQIYPHLAKLIYTALALAITITVSTQTNASDDVTQTAPTILVLGDSISAAYGMEEQYGWVVLLERELQATHPSIKIVNASISGETTGGALQRLPTALAKFNPQMVIIELGGNDALRGQSLKQMRNNLTSMVDLAAEQGAASLILGMRIPTNYGAIYTERFFKSFATVAEETGASLVPFFLEPIATDRSYFQPDGVHPTREAQVLMLQHVLEPILSVLDSLTLKAD